MTYGQLRLRLAQLAPSISLEILDGWISDRYTELLDLLPWKRIEADTVFQAATSTQSGTVTATQGQFAITGDANVIWSTALIGQVARINNTSEFYVIAGYAATTPPTLVLDRAFESPSGAGLTYRIDQSVFQMPLGTRVVRGMRAFHSPMDLEVTTTADLNRRFPARTEYGNPRYAAMTWDSNTDPPQLQVELYPMPDCPDSTGNILSWVVDYIYDPAALDVTQTSFSILPWVRPAAMLAGCRADAARHEKDWGAADRYETRFNDLARRMAMINAIQRGPVALRLAPEYMGRRPSYPGYHHGKHADQDYFGLDDFDA